MSGLLTLVTAPIGVAINAQGRREWATQMYEIVRSFKDAAFKNALQAFDDAKTSNEPRSEFIAAKNEFLTAISNAEIWYKQNADDWANRFIPGSRRYNAALQEMLAAGDRIIECYSMIIAIYAGLGERTNTLKYGAMLRKELTNSRSGKRYLEGLAVLLRFNISVEEEYFLFLDVPRAKKLLNN
jgi:hypothetical protein